MTEPLPSAQTPPPRPVWHRRLHWRLWMFYAALLAPALVALFVFLNYTLQQQLQERTRRQLTIDAKMVASAVSQSSLGDAADWDALADALAVGRSLSVDDGLRISFIDGNGRVLGDSEVASAEISKLEPHDMRPEIKEALSGPDGVGHATRYSQTLRQPLMYSARRLTLPELSPKTVVVRVACQRDAYKVLLSQVRQVLGGSALLVIVLVSFAGFMTSRLVSRPMTQISAAARQLATEPHQAPLPVARQDELGMLAESINALSSQLNARLSQIEEDKLLLSAVLDGITEGVIVCEANGRVVVVNPAARKLLELGDADVHGKLLLEVYRSPELKDALDEALRTKGAISRELIIRRRETLHLMVTAAALDRPQEQRDGAVAVLHDITRLRKLERIRRDFVANVSHELRTPLATITGYAETLLSGAIELDPTAQDFVETIERHVKRLNVMVSDLLVLARIEAEGQGPRLARVSLEAIDLEVRESVEVLADKHSVHIQSDLQHGPDVMAERRALTQVLRNLMENAIHYSEPGGEIVVRAESDAHGKVHIRVEDEGVGIEPRHLPRIFERFYRVDEGRSREVGGTGLGLAIVKHMVQAMNGDIHATSTPGRGSTFTVTLRAAEVINLPSGDRSEVV